MGEPEPDPLFVPTFARFGTGVFVCSHATLAWSLTVLEVFVESEPHVLEAIPERQNIPSIGVYPGCRLLRN